MSYKRTLALDFDAVLHAYAGWNEGKLSGPMPKARHACLLLEKDFKLICFSTRAANEEGKAAIERWLRQYGFPRMEVTAEKLPFFLTVDDRAICFTGTWDDKLLEQIRNFVPYWQKPQEADPPDQASESASLPIAEG